jgi:hypothetical protein
VSAPVLCERENSEQNKLASFLPSVHPAHSVLGMNCGPCGLISCRTQREMGAQEQCFGGDLVIPTLSLFSLCFLPSSLRSSSYLPAATATSPHSQSLTLALSSLPTSTSSTFASCHDCAHRTLLRPWPLHHPIYPSCLNVLTRSLV